MAGIFSLIFAYNRHITRRFFEVKPVARVITSVLFITVLLFVATSIYYFARSSFLFIMRDPFFRDAMPFYIYEYFFLIISGLVFFSSFISGLIRLFSRENNSWIVVSPRLTMMPLYLFSQISMVSLWPLIIVAFPMLMAVHTVFHLTWVGFLVAMVAMMILMTGITAASLLLLLVIAKVLYSLRSRHHARMLTQGRVAILALMVIALLTLFTWQRVASHDALKLFSVENTALTMAGIHEISNQFMVFPSHLVAVIIHSLVHRDVPSVVTAFEILVGLCALTITAMFVCFSWYLSLWQVLQENNFVAQSQQRMRSSRLTTFPRFFSGAIGAIFEKEAMLLYRNVGNLLWFAFVFFLWLVQVGLNLFIRRTDLAAGAHGAFPTAVTSFQILAAVFFVTAFVLRFAFPSFSIERKMSWIFGSAPVNYQKLFWAKYLFYIPLFSIMSVLIAVVNILILPFAVTTVSAFLIFIVISVIAVSTFGLCLGVFFPSFETDSPDMLSTSMPGLFFTMGAIAYGACGAFLFNMYLKNGTTTGIVVFEIISVAIAALLSATASRRVQYLTFE